MAESWACLLAGEPGVRVGAGPVPGVVTVAEFAEWTTAELSELGDRAAATGVVIPLRHDGALTVLGPVVGPGIPGCVGCADDARRTALGRTGDPARTVFRGAFSPAVLPLLRSLVTVIAADPPAAAGIVWLVSGVDAAVSAHSVVPRPDCPVCGALPADDPAGARFVLAARPVAGSGDLRGPNPATTLERLKDSLLDGRLGPVVSLGHVDGLPVPLASASTMIRGRSEGGYGRSTTYSQAERVALFEVLERRLEVAPRGRRTTLHAAYDELGPERAIDPVTLGLPDPRYDGHPHSRLTPYRPDIPTRWVYGWSLTREQAVAVPEHVAYYDLPARPDAPRFVDESSNGGGLGNSLEEAVLYGLFEVAERDAFLMAWYARTPLRRIAIPDEDPLVPHLADRLDELGYDLLLFDATNDLGVPVVLSLALHREERPDAAHACFCAGAHVDPRAALRSAALEVAVGVNTMALNSVRDTEYAPRDSLLRMLADSTEVRVLADHAALYSIPEARPRYEFLLEPAEPVDWRDLWPDNPTPAMDLTQVLTGLVAQLAELGLEPIVVDQTERWTRDRFGLHAAKVIVPGSLPMTFGHVHHRTRDLPRLLEVPVKLGRAPGVLDRADLPLHPHPFP